MNSPSDLVTAIVHAIEVEYLLEQLIITKLKRNDEATIEILCKDNGPLATFFSKIGLGYAMGLYDERLMEYLNAIRKIRNAFAHSRKDVSFGNSLIRAEMASLKLPANPRSRLFKQITLVRKLCLIEGRELSDGEKIEALVGRAAYVILCMMFSTSFLKRQDRSARARFRRFQAANRAGTSGLVGSDAMNTEIAEKFISIKGGE